jgi:hypothetical protein
MSLVKAIRASDDKTVWVQSEKVDGTEYTAIDVKPKAGKKNAKSK